MLHPQPLLPARAMEQINRFTLRVRLGAGRGGRRVDAHLANTGDLTSILRPDAELLVTPAGPGRKLPYRVVLARQWSRWVAVDAGLSSRLVEEALEQGRLPGFRGWRLERREPPSAGGRLDLLLRRGADRMWVEVKCTTLVRNRVARFPQPATARGRRHLEELAALATAGKRAAICFVAQRGDTQAFRTLSEVDPGLTQALADARSAGVRCRAYRCRVSRRGVWIRDEIPVLG